MATKQTAKQAFDSYERYKKMFDAGNPNVTQRMLDGLHSTAQSLMDTEMAAKEKNFLAKHTGSDWWELAKKQYPITQQNDGSYLVTSEARDWLEPKDWTFNYKYQAMEKVEKLVKWLHDGRTRKGHGDIDADIERFNAKYNSESN
jgi:hypothetical protein